jgi:hypothetical protein
MKRFHTIIMSILLLTTITLITSTSLKAQTNAGDFGLGLILGEPTGLSAKYYNGGTTAFDFGLAWSFGSNSNNANFHLHADYLIHRFDLIQVEQGRMPIYFGIGGRLRTSRDAHVGIRFPIGVSYYFERDPIELFFEVVPVFDLTPRSQVSGNGGLGFRFYFGKS